MILKNEAESNDWSVWLISVGIETAVVDRRSWLDRIISVNQSIINKAENE